MEPDGGKYAPKRRRGGGTAVHIRSLRHHTDRRRADAHIMLFQKRERAIRRILIVEDEPLVAFDNEYSLGEAGYEVVATVDTLADAVRVLAEEEIDLVLSDIKLSGDGDGMDVARAAAAKGVPVLFVTGNCPIEARTLGIGCLAKPYSDKILKTALEAVDQKLQGKDVKRVPAGLSLYEGA
jgi:DNA-binding response OmpR family regulator